MGDRFSVWLSVGIVTAGVSVAMLAGAGIAVADDSPTGSDKTSSSSESSNSVGNKQDSDRDAPKQGPKKDDEKDTSETGQQPSESEGDETSTEDQGTTDEGHKDPAPAEEGTPKKGRDHDAATPKTSDQRAKSTATDEVKKAVAEDAGNPVADTNDSDAPAQTEEVAAHPPVEADETGPVDEAVAATKAKQTPVATALAFTAAEPVAAPARPTLINVVGSFFWGLFDMFSKAISGPPAVPPGSTVTAGRSKLQIDCGDGYTADADWYFPTEGEPDKFIYFQHGFPGNAAVYNLTLTELAERNNAVVVAPSITGDVFACDACNLTGDPMHAAVAKLFEGDRAALLASAEAAGYEGTLPEQFVFVGHSHGGQLAAGASRYFEELAPANEKANLVGAVLLDSSAAGGALARALDKLPPDFPVLHISAAPALLNTFGSADAVFQQERPGQFNGIQLVGGTHSDGYRSSAVFGIAQFVVALATGPSTPENVEAVQVVTQGWITDMYAGRVYDPASRTGIYGVPGEPGENVIDIPTDAGLAHAYVLPAPRSQFTTLLSLVLGAFFELPTVFRLDVCAVDPSAAAATAACAAAPQTEI
jgi:pimeloyl-ACP methyl ester carboxylesterase